MARAAVVRAVGGVVGLVVVGQAEGMEVATVKEMEAVAMAL